MQELNDQIQFLIDYANTMDNVWLRVKLQEIQNNLKNLK